MWKAQIDHQGESITPKEAFGSHTLPFTTETQVPRNIMGIKSEYLRAELAPDLHAYCFKEDPLGNNAQDA